MSVCFASGLLLYSKNGIEQTNGNRDIDDNENKACVEYGNPSIERLGSELDVSSQDKELICSWAFMSAKTCTGPHQVSA